MSSPLVATDRPLNTSYKVLADIVDTNDETLVKKNVICLGTFDTILSFWQFWNGFKRKQTLKSLPKDVNLRVFRNIVQETTNPKQWCGETWSARLSSETDNQMTDAIIKICVQFASEQLSRMMNGVTFTRRANGDITIYNVEIWLEKGLPETVRRLNDILKKFCVDNSTTTVTHTSRTSGRVATLKEPETRYRVKEFETFEKTVGVQKMPNDLLIADLQSLFAPVPGSVVKTSRRKKKSKNKKNKSNGEEKGVEDNNHHINNNNHNGNGPVFSLDRSISAQSTHIHTGNSSGGVCHGQVSTLNLSTEKNGNGKEDSRDHTHHSNNTPMRNASNVHTRMRSHTVGSTTEVSQSLRNQVSRYFGNFQAYETTIVEKLDEKCQQTLVAEGCPVCLRNESLYGSTDKNQRNEHKQKTKDVCNKEISIEENMDENKYDEMTELTDTKEYEDESEPKTGELNESWVVIKCKLLSCQHVMHLSCAPNVSDVTLRSFHCSSFFRTFTPRNDEDDFETSSNDHPVRQIGIRFRVTHLLSDKSGDAIMNLTGVPTRWHQNSNKEYAMVTMKDEKREFFIPIRRGRIVCELEIPPLNNTNGKSNGAVHMTNGNMANGGNASSFKKMNRYDSNFEIPLPAYDLKSSSQLSKYVLVLAESQDYVLQVIVTEVLVGDKPRLQLLSLRYIFTPPESVTDNSNPIFNTEINGHNQQEMNHKEKKNADKEESSFAQDSDEDSIWVSNIKPRNDTSTPSSSSTRTQTPAPESVNVTPHTAGVTTIKTLNNDTTNSTARMKPLSLTTTGKTIGPSNNSVELNVRTSRNGMFISTAQVQHHKNASQLTPNGLMHAFSNSPGLSSLASPYPSTMDSPAHQPMATLSLNSTSNAHKFTPMNTSADRPFMSPATMSIDHLMTQNGLTTSNLLIPMTNHINGNNSPFWLASAQTPSLPPLGNVLASSVGLSSQQNYALNGDITLGGERAHDLIESHGINSIGNDLNITKGITSMTAAIGTRSTGSHGLCPSNGEANYRTDYTNSPLSNKSSGVNNIMGVLTNSPSRSEKYTPFVESNKIAITDKTNKLITEVFDTPNLTASKMTETIDTPMTPDLTSITVSTTNTRTNNGGGNSNSNTDNNHSNHANHTNPSLNTQLLTQLLSHPPFVNLLQQWGVTNTSLSAAEVGVALRQQINSTVVSNGNNSTASLGTQLSVGTQSSQSYDYVGVGPLINNTYGAAHFQQPSRNFGTHNPIYGVMNNTNMNVVHDMSGNLYLLSKTQEGSRMIQEKLHDVNNFALIYNELCTHIAELMMDNCGHYVIEALFIQASDLKKLEMLKMIERDIGTVVCHKQGSFSIQTLMEAFTNPEQMEQFVKMLQLDIKKIILSNSGHFVILRYLQRYKYPWTRFIHKAIMNYMVEFATDHYGLRVMKAAMDAGPADEMLGVYNAVVKHTNALVENQYGNYVIQHLMEIAPREITDGIKEKMHGKFVRYAKQKFSSNVVEKCLRHSQLELKGDIHNPKDWNTIIVRELCSKAGDLISDKYGNYCLQTALQTATLSTPLLEEFMRCCRPHLDNLRENVKTKWAKLLSTAASKNRQILPQKDIKAQ